MHSVNYFEHFGLPVSFTLDTGKLKKAYLEKSRQLHPDFYTLHDDTTQEEMLQKSSFNNQAYNTLRNEMTRTKYILGLNEIINGEEGTALPQEFLMEMMDINESMMELSMEYDENIENELRQEIENIGKSLRKGIEPVMEKYDHENPDQQKLALIKEFYFKTRYLWRLKENLDKFAAQD